MKSISINWKKGAYSFLFALLFSIIIVIPDYLLRIYSPHYVAHFHANTFVYIFLFMTSLFLIKSSKFFISVLFLVWILMLSSMYYLFHFGRYFLGVDIQLLFVETEDIYLGFATDLIKYWYLIFICVTLFFLSIYLRKKSFKYVYHSNLFIIVFLGVFLYQPYIVLRQGKEKNSPSPLRYIFRNGIKSLSSYIVQPDGKRNNFLPYEVTKQKDITTPTTIIFYMLESTSPNNMSLYGYERKTTPNLEKLKSDKKFIYKRAISSGVSTSISLSMFFNFQKEAQNYFTSFMKDNNLFKMARSQGFQTAMYSPQSSKTFSNVGIGFVDKAIYRDNARHKYNTLGDDYAFELLKSTPLKDKNFLVVQTRAVHYPYEKIYENLPQYDVFNDERKDFKLNSYDNAMLYLDELLYKVINWAKTLDGKVYLIMTSDHGQMMGQDNLWGHSFLDLRVAEVPFILYTKGVSQNDLFEMNNPPELLTHYDISKFIAKILGYEIINPNTPENIYYINGVDIDGDAGFIKYKLENNKIEEIK
ncbi:MAG: sulfatase-like hydrolase/transferase [Alphaproteobacteria bacterium]